MSNELADVMQFNLLWRIHSFTVEAGKDMTKLCEIMQLKNWSYTWQLQSIERGPEWEGEREKGSG